MPHSDTCKSLLDKPACASTARCSPGITRSKAVRCARALALQCCQRSGRQAALQPRAWKELYRMGFSVSLGSSGRAGVIGIQPRAWNELCRMGFDARSASRTTRRLRWPRAPRSRNSSSIAAPRLEMGRRPARRARDRPQAGVRAAPARQALQGLACGWARPAGGGTHSCPLSRLCTYPRRPAWPVML